MHTYGLNKRQRLCSHTAIDKLFSPAERTGGSNHVSTSYPWRAIWRIDGRKENGIKILISVPKKKLRHAVDRVKMRRRCREAFRLNQYSYPDNYSLNIAFIYIGKDLSDFSITNQSIIKISDLIKEKLSYFGKL